MLGRGVFGKCFAAKLGHIDVCVKVFRKEPTYAATFPVETSLLSKCCHENLPWLYGVYEEGSQRAIIMSLHTYQGTPITIHKLLCNDCHVSLDFDAGTWKKVILGMAGGVQYLHSINVLHNDIKGDNILLQRNINGVHSIIADVGKGCFVCNAKGYTLSKQKKLDYAKYHPQIAPDLVAGHCKQSKQSDIYSVGRVLKAVNKVLNYPELETFSLRCMAYLCTERPKDVDHLYDILY